MYLSSFHVGNCPDRRVELAKGGTRAAVVANAMDAAPPQVRREAVYSGYSVGPCVLAPTLRGLEAVDGASVVEEIYGVGLASSVEIARLGFSVVAAVHHPDQLATANDEADAAGQADRVHTEVLDVTDERWARELVDRVQPWGLVNNAGVTTAGALDDVPVDEARRQFETIVFAPMRLARLALPHMRRGGGGRIVNVSSIASDVHVPLLGWYQAAKSALSSLSDALLQEVAHHGVEVIVVEPGIIDTPIWDDVRQELRQRRAEALEANVYDEAPQVIDRVTERASDVARAAETTGAADGEDLGCVSHQSRHSAGDGHGPCRLTGRRRRIGAHQCSGAPALGRAVPGSNRGGSSGPVADRLPHAADRRGEPGDPLQVGSGVDLGVSRRPGGAPRR
jgi:NAD(P)-dependent dehydrogenase (short-subunit alcohol dehydrogenase family)